jgi:hypothetical protein
MEELEIDLDLLEPTYNTSDLGVCLLLPEEKERKGKFFKARYIFYTANFELFGRGLGLLATLSPEVLGTVPKNFIMYQ